jgi:enoyl-CoA hydratase
MALVEISDHPGGTRLLRLNDPDRRNVISLALGDVLRTAVADCLTAGVPAVVITGQGSAFCAGADLPELFGEPGRSLDDTRAVLQNYYRAFLDVRELPMPTIAAVNGPAVGAGLNLALACDVRIAGVTAAFGATFARIGLHPGGGCTWLLVQQIGYARALEVLLRGQTLDAGAAVAAGLASGPSDDPLDDALKLSAEIADIEPELATQIKATAQLAANGGSFDTVLTAETNAQALSTGSERLQAWVDRFR